MARRNELDRFREAVNGARSQTLHSPLYRWLRQNHDAFLAEWGGERADWQAFVEGFAALGLTDRTGKPPTRETARKTWMRVRADAAKAKARKAAGHKSLEREEIAPGVCAVAADPPAACVQPHDGPLTLRPARPGMGFPPFLSATVPTASALTNPEPVIDGDSSDGQGMATPFEVERRRLQAQMDGGKVPISKPVTPFGR